MKGIIFTEFLEMVESAHSLDFVDELIDASDLPRDGSYTSVGTYPCSELVSLLMLYSERVGTPPDDLLKAFGHKLFDRFHVLYPEFFGTSKDAFAFLEGVDAYIHMEVRKLYPEAELPSFEPHRDAKGNLALEYRSARPLAALAEGLILGCMDHFGESADLEVEDRSAGAGTHALFSMRRPAA